MTLIRKCLWCGVRRGSICAAISSMVYCVLTFVCAFYAHKHIRVKDELEELKWLTYVTFIFSVMNFIASMLVIRGIMDDRRDSRMLLIPFIVLMTMFVGVQLVGWVQIILTVKILIVAIMYLLGTCFSIFMNLCVISQYQELKDGRGTKASYNTTEEPPVMYIAVSDRMTLPFSKVGSDSAAVYTTRVPSPFDPPMSNQSMGGSKSVEPSRRWTGIDYEYPARPQSSAAGSYVQNLCQHDGASTQTESTFFFPMNTTDNNDENDTVDAIVASAPSESGSYLPVGRALSYPSTPANNTPYMSSTLNRRTFVETRNSSRSLSYLPEVAGNQHQNGSFGVKHFAAPPQYHSISMKEKVESIV
ncbi:uncharacterized protein [Antedon mediterranea]|uniref:uncharacterized protein n=1 Tax=Antedon mediterranea TaxID=105859 RepID=UPI003AF9B094